jgi:hypothetical protein
MFMVTSMHNQPMFSAILGLSSKRCVCGIMLDGPSDALEINVRYPRGSLFACPMYGWPAAEAAEGRQRRAHGKVINEHCCIDAIVPLLSP